MISLEKDHTFQKRAASAQIYAETALSIGEERRERREQRRGEGVRGKERRGGAGRRREERRMGKGERRKRGEGRRGEGRRGEGRVCVKLTRPNQNTRLYKW